MSAKCAITDDGGNMKCRATLKAGLASVICVASLKATVPQPEVIQSKQFVYSFLEVWREKMAETQYDEGK